MGFFKALGRKLGQAITWVGEKTGIESIERAGYALQDACRETSKRTGSTNTYDQNTATVDETARIAEILSGFSSSLHQKGELIEQSAKQFVTEYFDSLHSAMGAVLGQTGAVKSLVVQKQLIVDSIDGSFNDVLSGRVSLTDSECLAILKLPKGAEKESKMHAFGVKVINEGVEKLCHKIEQSVKSIQDSTTTELEDMVKEQQKSLEKIAGQVKEFVANRQHDIDIGEQAVLLPSQTLAASEILLELIREV